MQSVIGLGREMARPFPPLLGGQSAYVLPSTPQAAYATTRAITWIQHLKSSPIYFFPTDSFLSIVHLTQFNSHGFLQGKSEVLVVHSLKAFEISGCIAPRRCIHHSPDCGVDWVSLTI